LECVSVSLDGNSSVVHKFLRKTSFNDIEKGINMLIDAGIKVGLETMLTRRNISCLDRIKEYINQ